MRVGVERIDFSKKIYKLRAKINNKNNNMARQCNEQARTKRRVRRAILKKKKAEKEKLLGETKKVLLTPDRISKLTEKPAPRPWSWY